MSDNLETTASAGWRTEYRFNHIATAAHGSARYPAADMPTDSSASADRTDDTNTHAPTDEHIEQLVDQLRDRLDEQGSPTYLKQRYVVDSVPRQTVGHAFEAIDRDPSTSIGCTLWSEHPKLWQVRRTAADVDSTAASGGRA